MSNAQLTDIHALVAALKQLDYPSDEIVRRVRQVGQDLRQCEIDKEECDSLYNFIDEIEESEEKSEYHQLYELYQREISSFGEQEKNKGKPISDNSSLPPIRSAENAAGNIDYLISYDPNQSDSSQEDSSQRQNQQDSRMGMEADEAALRGLP